MVFIKLITSNKQSRSTLSPLDKFEFLIKENDVLNYALDNKGYYCYIKNEYLFLKRIEPGTKEMKNILNVKIDERFDRVIYMKNFLLFNDNDITINQMVTPQTKFSRNDIQSIDLPKFATRYIEYKKGENTHLMVFEGLFILTHDGLKVVYKESVVFSYFFKNILFYQNSVHLYAIIPYFVINSQPLKVQIAESTQLPLHTLSMIRLINGQLLIVNEKLELAIIDIDDPYLRIAILIELGEYKDALEIVNPLPLDQQLVIAKGLITLGLLNMLFKIKKIDYLILALASAVHILNSRVVKEFIHKANIYLSFTGDNGLVKEFGEVVKKNSADLSIVQPKVQSVKSNSQK